MVIYGAASIVAGIEFVKRTKLDPRHSGGVFVARVAVVAVLAFLVSGYSLGSPQSIIGVFLMVPYSASGIFHAIDFVTNKFANHKHEQEYTDLNDC